MTSQRFRPNDPRIQVALSQLQEIIRAGHPEVRFEVSEGEDPDGVYLTATVDVEDTDEVASLYIDRLLDLQIEDGLPIYVLPIRPVERVVAELQEELVRPVAQLLP